MSQIKETKEPKDAKGAGKPRVYQLANDLNLDSKAILEFCKELGFSHVKNQLSALDPEQADAVRDRVKKGPKTPSASAPATAKPAIPPKLDAKIPTLVKPKSLPGIKPVVAPVAAAPDEAIPHGPVAAAPPDVVASEIVAEPDSVVEPVVATAVEEPPVVVEPIAAAPNLPPPMPAPRGVPNLNTRPQNLSSRPQNLGTSPPRPTAPPAGGPTAPRPAPFSAAGAPPARPASAPPQPGPPRGPGGPGGPRPAQIGGPRTGPGGMPSRGGPGGPRTGPGGMPPRGGGPGGPARPAGPIPPRSATAPPGASNKSVKLTPEQIDRLRLLERQRGGKLGMGDIHKATTQPTAVPPGPGGPVQPPGPGGRPQRPFTPAEGGEDEDKKAGPGGKKPGEVAGRDARHKARQDKGRQSRPVTDRGSIIIGAGGQVDMIDRSYGSRIKKHRGKQHVSRKVGPVTGKVDITIPITVRSLSETIGIKSGELLLKLKNLTNSLYTINSNVEFDVAEMVAIERGVELVAKKSETAEDVVVRKLKERAEASEAANVIPRPPIVTIMGHVDHGKTSLLDKIRQTYGLASDVVSTEAGGITQVLRAWRVEKDGKATTFLDTPGHEAFTKMRARGANVTDIAVIVVSASDGVMPQTEEAIAHARAAEVDIIVAINKVDLPDANIDKTRRQLYQLNLLPDDMGGETPFVQCSAKTGQGIGDLLDAIQVLGELSDPPLQADPTLDGSGTCLEAYKEGERGVVATLLVQNGTLRKGDVLLCGATYGRVRAMYDDLGRPTEEAGPSTPVKIIGLDDVPDADDPFYVVDDVGTAQEIASRRADQKQEAALSKFSPVSLDSLKESHAKAKITELKVILKAEARGSVEAIKKELEKLIHEEVRVRVLHSGIGAITESDVTLALTSPDDTLIVGFNVTADDAGLRLAEQWGVSLREYQIIYNLVDDIKAALEGRLKPIEEVVHLGRAVVRAQFRVSKVGTIAGCHVTSGVIERSAKVRVIREGTVVYPPAERTASLDSLKRFKDDVKEVREGFECGMKVAGFDDVKVGDVIEAYRIEIKQRTL